MTYQHKEKSCAQETKSIVQNIFKSSSDEYKLTKASEASRFLQSSDSSKSTAQENVLPDDASFDLEKDEPAKAMPAAEVESESPKEEKLDRYLPTHSVKFEASEAQEASEKKKGRRNYMEFRSDYRKKKEEPD